MSQELNPCPFCGGEAEKQEYATMVTIGCQPCGYTRSFKGPLSDAEITAPDERGVAKFINPSRDYKHSHVTDAIAAWNRRTEYADLAALREENARLTVALEEIVSARTVTASPRQLSHELQRIASAALSIPAAERESNAAPKEPK